MADDLDGFGPAMRACTPLQRAFVLAMASDPFGNATKWTKAAGYRNSEVGYRVMAHRLMHDEKIQAAVAEVARGALFTVGPVLAAQGMLRIARDRKHPKHLRAVEMVANRVGLHETTEHVVRVDDARRDPATMIARIRELAAQLGVDPARLLGANVGPATPLIEHEPKGGV